MVTSNNKYSYNDLRINAERFKKQFDAISKIGKTDDGGVHRPAFSEAHGEVRRCFLNMAVESGLETRADGAGNHSAILQSKHPKAKTLIMGSHLDSVPYGGRFDGALGVLAALEVLQTVKENDIDLNVHLEAMDFTDEEGRFVGLMGSQALTGTLHPEILDHPGEDIHLFLQSLKKNGLSSDSILSAKREPGSIASYLEIHIEQGRRLEKANIPIGIVTGIVGIWSFKIQFQGRADHAGTTAMDQRMDAGLGASAFTLAVREMVVEKFPGGVVTVGNMQFEPGAFNVVPETVTVSIEFRNDNVQSLNEMRDAVFQLASDEANRFGLSVKIEPVEQSIPLHMNPVLMKSIGNACDVLGLDSLELPSGAGHDAQVMAQVCPSGMIFIPSVGGYSHSSREFSKWEDCVNGANVQLQTILHLAELN